jgi:RNA polymerase sigma-70 factor (ECF subfamily)
LADAESFRRIFEYYAPRLRAFFARRGALPTTSDELVQEVMLTVWKKGDLFDPTRASLGTWIFTIARNKHLDRLRRPHPEPDPEDPVWLGDRPRQTEAPDANASTNQSRDRLRKAVMTLPEELRSLLLQLYFEGKSMSEVADETGTALGTVKSRARRALSALRQSVSEGDEP